MNIKTILEAILGVLLWVLRAVLSMFGGLSTGLIIKVGPSLNIGHPVTVAAKSEILLFALVGSLVPLIRLLRHNDLWCATFYLVGIVVALLFFG